MAQIGNLSSWAGTSRPQTPRFLFPASETRASFVLQTLISAFPQLKVGSVRMLRNYDCEPLYEASLQGIYAVEIPLPRRAPGGMVVHVKSKSDEGTIAFGARVFDRLREGGVIATRYLRTEHGLFNQPVDRYTAYFTELEKGEHPVSRPDVLYAFGRAIGSIRTILDSLPDHDKDQIRSNSCGRYKLWQDGVVQWRTKGSHFAAAHRNTRSVFDCCADLLECHMPDIAYGSANHFDLIEANSLYRYLNHTEPRIEVCVLDCDTVWSGWAPRYYDLGTFAFRVGLNMPVEASSEELPELNAQVLEPLRHGFRDTSGDNLSKDLFLKHAMETAAMAMMAIPGREAQAENMATLPLTELRLHTEKMTEKVGRMIQVYEANG